MTKEEARKHKNAIKQYCILFWSIRNDPMYGRMPLSFFIRYKANTIQQLGMWYRQVIKQEPNWAGK